ncbi:unnamed protein product [Paramecium primaurelia]|uniref:Transmembrane protein n=1 Tax=Paramecium primaurelia TaxID=5886 RepID=A0A8S1PG04_PARPR|nr:unnamed protein product [Paramecium primaurelia]
MLYSQKNDYDIHAITMSIVVLPSIKAELLMIFSRNIPPLKGNQRLQRFLNIIGYTFLSLMIFQILGRIIIKFCIQSVNEQIQKLHPYQYLFGIKNLSSWKNLSRIWILYDLSQKEIGKGDINTFWCVNNGNFYLHIKNLPQKIFLTSQYLLQ